MAAPQASSRLEMLQARFQQKQLQEKEQKLLQLYDQQQQRAYQVVQRGSAGSNGSNHGSSIRSTATHTTSTSQGGKVRQMFDERRQTTVKGIDRSYPLEPLESKLRKQTTNANGLASQRNGNPTTVNRQSVSVKRVARADVNSNVNGGKPVVSYREEVTRESFGPQRHGDEEEFGSENRVTANGHHRHDLDNEEEALDQETIDRNRLMAKVHLMGFDDSLKHRVRNELENEEFPEYLMVDAPDKVTKRNVTKKLSQAEARLERFKLANAKRNNNNATKQSATASAALKRGTEQVLPVGSNSRGSEIADGTSPGGARSGSNRVREYGRRDPQIAEEMSGIRREELDIEAFRRGASPPRNSPLGRFDKVETKWRSYSPDNYFKSLTSDGKIITRRGLSPRFFRVETERSGATVGVDRGSIGLRTMSADRRTYEVRTDPGTSAEVFGRGDGRLAMTIGERARGPTMSSLARERLTKQRGRSVSAERQKRDTGDRRSSSPEFFCTEGEKSATTMLIDRRGSSTSHDDREILTQRSERSEGVATNIDRKYAEITRSSYPQLFLKDSGRPSMTMSLDREDFNFESTSADRQMSETRAGRSSRPEFFRGEERSATTIGDRARGPTMSSLAREILTQQRRRSVSAEREQRETGGSRSTSPEFFREDERSATTIGDRARGPTMSSLAREMLTQQRRRSVSAERQQRETGLSRSTSPEFFCVEGEKSATTMLVDRRGSAPYDDREILTQQIKQSEGVATSVDRKYSAITRSSHPRFFLKDSGRSIMTMSLDRKDFNLQSTSADRRMREARASRSRSPEFFREGERSTTTMTIDQRARGPTISSLTREMLTRQSRRSKGATTSVDRRYAEITRSPSPRSFRTESERSDATVIIDRGGLGMRSVSADRQTWETRASRSESPTFSSTSPFFLQDSRKPSGTPTTDRRSAHSRSSSADGPARRDRGPEFFCKEGEKSATTMLIDRSGSSSSRDREILTRPSERGEGAATSIDRKYAEITRGKKSSSSPQFFCKESEKSATTMLIEPKFASTGAKSVLKGRKYTPDTSYKQPASLSSPGNKGARFTPVGRSSSPPLAKGGAKRNSKRNEVSDVVVRSNGRRSSRISNIPATSTSSIVSLKYGLEFDNILQSTGLVRKFMKSQPGEQRGTLHRRSPWKQDIKNARAVRNGQPRNRYKLSPLSQKSRSLSMDSRGRTTPDYSRKSVTPTELDMEIKEITMTDHRMEPRKSSSPEQSRSPIGTSITSKKIISPKRDGGRQHEVTLKTPSRFSPLGRTVRYGNGIPKTSSPRRVGDQKAGQNYSSKYSTCGVKDRKRRSILTGRAGSPNLSDNELNVKDKPGESRGLPKVTSTQQEDESQRNIERMDLLSAQKSALRRLFDSSAVARPRSSTRASSEIFSRTTDDEACETPNDATLKSTLRAPSRDGSPKAGNGARKSDLKTIPNKVIYSSRRITKIYRSSAENQRRSPTCKRQLFEADPKKEARERSFVKTRGYEGCSPANVRSRRDQATSKPLKDLDVAKRWEEVPTISVKPLRSIEDIRSTIGYHEGSMLTAAKRSRSAIANSHSSASRKGDDTRRSVSASSSARRVLSFEDEPVRLTKIQSCVSRIAKSPSPDARKQHETSARATRGSNPSSPSKSPDVAPGRGSTEPRSQDARPPRRSVVAKTAESIGSKTSSGEADEVDGVVQQNNPPHESSSAKRPNAFVIDLDDRSKESNATSPKKVTSIRRPSNDKYQTTPSPSGRSTSSSFGGGGTTTSGGKSRMATKVKTPVSGGSQTKGSPSARNVGGTNSTDNLATCNTCGRSFAQDRIDLHEQICAKTMNKKRKQFDAMTFRVKGTELEPFAKKGVAGVKKRESNQKKPELKSNWRRKHEEFIEAIRSAKMVQAHLAAGGNIKDLPPPPPSDTSDYIQCPHCNRRFNQAAAERHIPKCEHMLHNKPANARTMRTRR